MSNQPATTTNGHTNERQVHKGKPGILDELLSEAESSARVGGEALASLAWLWPIRGLIYTAFHPQIILSVRNALVKSFGTSVVVFAVLALFTYVPQAALLSLLAGPLGPVLAIFLVGAESIFLLTFLAKPLFLEPALQHVFDATLLTQGQSQLVKDGKTRYAGMADKESALLRPLHALSRDGVLRYLITLPLNLIPVLGTVMFLFINGHRAGPSWHARYFQLKGYDRTARRRMVEQHRPEYTAFGVGALLFSFIPVVGLLFTFTNTVGAALWAADMEARANILEGPNSTRDSIKTL